MSEGQGGHIETVRLYEPKLTEWLLTSSNDFSFLESKGKEDASP